MVICSFSPVRDICFLADYRLQLEGLPGGDRHRTAATQRALTRVLTDHEGVSI